MKFLNKYYGLILILILSFWAIKPLFISGFFPMHDDTQVARVFEMGKMLSSGVFPVRWVPDLGYGYGYPIFNFYAPLAYYAGGVFMLLGFDALVATKIMMALGIILSGVFMYFLAKEFFGKFGGVVAGLFYIYAPYHALDIYVRGDVAEFWAYAFIPLMALGFYKRSILIGSIGFAGIILSHNLTALMVTPFLIIAILLYCYIAYKKKSIFTIYYLLFTFFLGLAMSAFYWIPALAELKYTNVLSQIGGGADFRHHFACLGQLWDSHWGFGGSAPGCIDGFSLKIGKLHILSVAAAMGILIFNLFKRGVNHFNNIYYLSIFGFAICVFLMLDISRFVWEAIPVMAFFQFPWRFLILASFFSSFLSGFVIWFLKRKFTDSHFNTLMYCSAAVVVVFFLLFFNAKLFSPQTILNKTSTDYTSEYALKWITSKISDEYLPPNFKKPGSEFEVARKPLPFKETAVQKASNLVSLVGVLALIIGIIFKYAKTKR